MENAVKPLMKPSSNISEFVSRFAKVCRFRSIGVFSENPNSNPKSPNVALGEESSDATGETECENVEKIHPQPVEISPKSSDYDFVIMYLFETISALKLAYIQLQEAHIPYDCQKIKDADEAVMAELEALCKIKRAFKTKPKQTDSPLRLLVAEIQVHERLLDKLESQIGDKESQIANLRKEFRDLELKNEKLVVKLKQQKSFENENIRILNFVSIREMFSLVSKSIHDFAKPLISLMMASGWDLDLAANSIEDGVLYSKRSHKKYAFEAYIARRMFYGFSGKKPYNIDDIMMRFNDPIDALMNDPDSKFGKFCRSKYLLVVHSKMEASFFGNLDQMTFVLNGKHPRTPLYQAFVKMAKWVWVLQGMVASIEPEAEIFGVPKRSRYSDVYMECCVGEKKENADNFQVELMVMPGFRIGESVIKSRVYLSQVKSPSRQSLDW